jgi:type IV pilus assembly protein PilX
MLANYKISLQTGRRQPGQLPAAQRGVVLVIALIVLVAMTLAALGLMRSVDTSNLVSGNLAFQQAATHSSDQAVEYAISWLENCNAASPLCPTTLGQNTPGNGYFADGLNPSHSPSAGQTWDDFWTASITTLTHDYSQQLPMDAAGNQPYYVIDRLCENQGTKELGAKCAEYPITIASPGEEEGGQVQLRKYKLTYYRITVRTVGPRNTVSYTQALVAM